ncbi:MarR family winged helix-turn-helix transcriptional regulator [Dietzia sp.]|uniref:MarR family winged helix-turn-helix transcriptional regulator n=1 Tax=Dietzia sp. TaxID=1871616 RepID=UPI002FDB3472
MGDTSGQRAKRERLSPDREVASLFKRLEETRRVAAANAALGAADGRILWLLSSGDELTLREISEKLNLEQSTVNRQVNAAVKSGFVEKRRSGARGAWQFSQTELGRESFDSDLEWHLDLYRRGLEELDEDERATFIELLNRVVGGYEAGVRTSLWSRM